ncbi:MAG TPA: periplasmic heavy metal sensor, partial [bacterium]|nr:periplasmic heavy metal sensor [bacterium]
LMRGASLLIVVLACTVWGAVAAPSAHTQRWGGPARHLGYVLYRLNLTPDQQHAVANILRAHEQQFLDEAAQAYQTRKAVVTTLSQEGASDSTLTGQIEAATTAHKQIALTWVQTRREILNVLTPEQRTQLSEMAGKLLSRMDSWHGKSDPKAGLDELIQRLSK